MHEREISHLRSYNGRRKNPIDRLDQLSGLKTVALRRNSHLSPTLLTTRPRTRTKRLVCESLDRACLRRLSERTCL